nr:hypothetical protein [Paenibacillus sp. Y412MC10]
MATLDDFFKLDIRIGTVLKANHFPYIPNPEMKLEIGFGEWVLSVDGFESEVLVIGGIPEEGDVVLL